VPEESKKAGCLLSACILGFALIVVFVLSSVLSDREASKHAEEEAKKSPTQRAQETKQREIQEKQRAADAEKERLASRTPLEVATDETKLVNYTWHKSGFGNVMVASFTIRNSSPYNVKDFDIRCEHSARSGTVIDHNEQTVYEIVKSRSTRTFRDVSMGFIDPQAAASGCEILRLSLVITPP